MSWGKAENATYQGDAWGAVGGVGSAAWGGYEDIIAPYMVVISPIDGDSEVPIIGPIVFSIRDDYGLPIENIVVYVEGEIVFFSGSFSDGWETSVYYINAYNSFDFILIPNAGNALTEQKNIIVRVVASDYVGLSLDESWSFTTAGEVFSLSIYTMLTRSIREMDKKSPGLLQKILQNSGGVDDIWKEKIYDRATTLWDMYSPLNAPAKWLPWLKSLVGLSRDISLDATTEELRGIIYSASTMWRDKPTELSLEDAVRTVTGNKLKIRNYFDFRMQLDSSILTEMVENFDPHLLDFPSITPSGNELTWCHATAVYPCTHQFFIGDLPDAYFPGQQFASDHQYQYLEITAWPADPSFVGFYKIDQLYKDTTGGSIQAAEPVGPNSSDTGSWRLWGGNSDFVTELRLMDAPSGTGVVNRELLQDMIELIRPVGERIDIVYVDLLDEFIAPKDVGMWSFTGATHPYVPEPGGRLVIPAISSIFYGQIYAYSWGDRTAIIKVEAESISTTVEFRFAVVDANNYYYVEIDYTAQTIDLYKMVAGAPALLGTIVRLDLIPDYVDTFRVNMITEGSNILLQVKYNGDLLYEQVDAPATFTTGTVQVYAIGDIAYLYYIEVMVLPAQSDRVGPIT